MKKDISLEYLRILATIAVVTNHVCAGLFNNFEIDELGRVNSAFINSTYTLVSWGVPVFLMITGALLLNPNKVIEFQKIKKYISRMAIVLVTFGWVYSVIELIFNGSPVSVLTVLQGYLNMLEGNSWSHMWYIYTIISLYLITVPLKAMLKGIKQTDLDTIIVILVIGNFIIKTINDAFGLEIYDYMQFGNYLTWYILGYYLTYRIEPFLFRRKDFYIKTCWLLLLASSLFRYSAVMAVVLTKGMVPQIAFRGNVFQFIQAVALFELIRLVCAGKTLCFHPILNNISRCSFSIYLIHPVIANVLYKVLNITPLSFPVCLGIVIMLVVIFGISWLSANIMIRIPILKKVV